MCVNCRRRMGRVIYPKPCKRCGKIFQPRTNHFKLCADCISEQFGHKFSNKPNKNPCDKCVFLAHCRENIYDMDWWPPCWVASEEREQFLKIYANQNKFQARLAQYSEVVENE